MTEKPPVKPDPKQEREDMPVEENNKQDHDAQGRATHDGKHQGDKRGENPMNYNRTGNK